MDPFQLLIDEHDHILRALDVLEVVAGRLERDEADARTQMGTMVKFIQRYADACHHAKEENVLFGVLIEHGIPSPGGPVDMMLAEHVEGRELVTRVAAHLEDPPAAAKDEAIGAAYSFAMLLRDHIRKENEVLFMMGRNLVPDTEDRQILDAFARYEASAISADEKASLLASLDALDREISA